MSRPGIRTPPGVVPPWRASAKSHAATTAKQGFTNSDGWMEMPARLIQRRAPLISAPTMSVSTRASRLRAKPIIARRRTVRGGCIDTAMMTAIATGVSASCRLTKWKLSAPIRSATAGLAARTRSEPKPISTARPAITQRSTVHHQWPIGLRSMRVRLPIRVHQGPRRGRSGRRPVRGSRQRLHQGPESLAPRFEIAELVEGGAGRRQQHDRPRMAALPGALRRLRHGGLERA